MHLIVIILHDCLIQKGVAKYMTLQFSSWNELTKLRLLGLWKLIISSGTVFTRLPKPVYEVFRNAYVAKTVNLPRAPMSPMFDTCYNLSGLGPIQVPNVSFFFAAGPILTLKIRNILVEHESYIGERIFCFAFVPTNNHRSIIGSDPQIWIFLVAFD
jgi:hypothetical protein